MMPWFPSHANTADFGKAPDWRAISAPALKRAIVGMLRMPNREPNAGDASVSTFPTRRDRLKSDAISPTTGAKLLHGPHHGAQNH
jgi:hypothetical protein